MAACEQKLRTRFFVLSLLLASAGDALGQAACTDGVLAGAFPTVKKSPASFMTLEARCGDKGYGRSERELTECYGQAFSSEPPFHYDLSKVSGCSGGECTECDGCGRPLRVAVNSFSIEGFRYDPRAGYLTVTVNAELYWADPRLYHTMVSNIDHVWKPSLKVLIQSVNETERKDLLKGELVKLLDTEEEEKKEKASVYKQRLDKDEGYAWMIRGSKVVCKELDLRGDCNLQKLETCGVTERLNEKVTFNLLGSNFVSFPFDQHHLRLQFFFTDPYKSIPYEDHEEWGISTPITPDWQWDKEGESVEFNNADGTTTMVHHSLYESLNKLVIAEYDAKWTVKVDETHDGGRLVIQVQLDHTWVKFFVRFIIPSLMMTYTTTVVAWLEMPGMIHPRNFICILSLLLGVTLLNGSSGASPTVSSGISWFDKVTICSILTSFTALLQNIVVYYCHVHHNPALGSAIDSVWRKTFVLAYTCLIFEVSVWDLADIPRYSGSLVIGLLILAFLFAWVGYWSRRELIKYREDVAAGRYAEVGSDKGKRTSMVVFDCEGGPNMSFERGNDPPIYHSSSIQHHSAFNKGEHRSASNKGEHYSAHDKGGTWVQPSAETALDPVMTHQTQLDWNMMQYPRVLAAPPVALPQLPGSTHAQGDLVYQRDTSAPDYCSY